MNCGHAGSSVFWRQKAEAYNVTGEELKQLIERVERLEHEKQDIAEQIKEVFAEIKGRGFKAGDLMSRRSGSSCAYASMTPMPSPNRKP